MRTEARYVGPVADAETVRALAGPGANCLPYRVTNHYLDVADGRFGVATMGSPRLRLRIYESGSVRFGRLEYKRQVARGRTEKTVWPVEQARDLLAEAMPWLKDTQLVAPSPEHELAVLAAAVVEERFDFEGLRYVCSMTYRRISCLGAGAGVRVTADYDFEPAVIGPDEMIVETKGDTTLPEAALAALGLRPLAQSKFALLSRAAA